MQNLTIDGTKPKSFVEEETNLWLSDSHFLVEGHDLNAKLARASQRFLKSDWYGKAVLILVLSNAAWIGVDIDWKQGEHQGSIPSVVFTFMDIAFCILFILEIMLRLFSYQAKLLFFKDPSSWQSNWFDLFLTVMMLVEVFVFSAFPQFDAHLRQFMVLRMIRFMRLLRISRIFRMVPELGIVVKSLRRGIRTVSSTLFFELGIMYVFGVILTQWTVEHENPCFVEMADDACFLHEYFGSIGKSMLTLLQVLVFDSTFALLRPILADSWYMGMILILFMVIGSWTVLNMLIGIICEMMSTGAEQEKKALLECRLREVFALMDSDCNGSVSLQEFNRNGGQDLLASLGIESDIQRDAFSYIDADLSGEFEVDEFIDMLFKLLSPPESQQIMVLTKMIQDIHGELHVHSFAKSQKDHMKDVKKARKKEKKESRRHLSKDLPEAAGSDSIRLSRDFRDSNFRDSNQERLDDAASESSSDSNQGEVPFQKTGFKTPGLHRVDTGLDAGTSPVVHHAHLLPWSKLLTADGESEGSEWQASEAIQNQQQQAQGIFENLQQLVRSAEKAEEALKFVYGMDFRESSDTANIDDVLQEAGVHDLSMDDKAEVAVLVEQYRALCRQSLHQVLDKTIDSSYQARRFGEEEQRGDPNLTYTEL